MRTLLDIDAGQALQEHWRRFDGLEGWRRQLQDGPTALETLAAVPVAQHAVMAHADEARRQHMQQLCGEANYVARAPEDPMLLSPGR